MLLTDHTFMDSYLSQSLYRDLMTIVPSLIIYQDLVRLAVSRPGPLHLLVVALAFACLGPH